MDPSAPASTIRSSYISKVILRLVVCIAVVVAITAVLYVLPIRDRPIYAALTFLFVVLLVSAVLGFRYAVFVSFLAALGFSWLAPPLGRFSISDSRDVFSLAAFLVIGVIGSYLSARSRKEALNANQRRAEAVAARQRFADLVNSVEGIVWEADAETFAFSFVSDQAERILGYPTERWVSEPTFWKEHLHPEDREWAVQSRRDATAQKRSYDFEYRVIAADGGVVWIRDLVTAVVENGRATRLRGVMVDITRRKRNEETVQEQANLLNLTHDSIFVRDMNDVIIYWNRGAEDFYGWTGQEAIGKVSHELTQTAFPAPLENVQAELQREGRWEGELVHTRKDGSQVVVASRWSLQRDSNGTPIAILETNNDISEAKRGEQAREELEEQWRAAFESNPTMYFMVDAAGAIVSVNAFGEEQLGYSEGELLGQPVLNLFHEADRDAVQRHASACFERPGRTMKWEARKIHKDGTMLWVRETANAVFLKKRPMLLVVCENITEQKRAEEAARRSERELRDVIETVPVITFSTRTDGSVEFINRRWMEYSGMSAEGTGWQSTLHPEDRERAVHKWLASVESGEPLENELRHRSTSGEYRWFLVRAVPLRDEHGNILKWYGTLTDIEDRKRAEQALSRSEAYLAEAQRLSHTGSWAYKPGTTKAFYWSEEMFRIWGFDSTQGPPDNEMAWQRIHPEDLKKIREYIEDARESNLRSEIVEDHRIVLPDGTVKHIHGTSHPVFDDAGQIVEYVGTAVDVTERKRAEEALRRSEAYLSEAQRLSKTGSWAWDPRSDKMIYCSAEICRIFGVDAPEHLPSTEVLLERVHPEDRDRVRAQSIRGGSDKTEHGIEYRLLLPDGTIKHVLSMRHPVFDGAGDLIEVIGTAVDVTERKRAEEELERLHQLEADMAHMNRVTTLGELTASLAHEINQPIAAAVTNANTSVRWLASENPNIGEAREAAKRAAKDATRAAEIINRIRALFKKGEAQRESVAVNDIIDDMIVLLHNEAIRYVVSIHRELAGDLPHVMADRVQLQQVLLNLMVNGIDAMKGVDGTRELTLISQHAGSDQILVSVGDNGVGLPPDMGQIFNAFFTTKPHGTGMGLAISRTIIESHGGRLWASSNSGPGATFHFTLPIKV